MTGNLPMFAGPKDATFWFPPQASTNAELVDWVYYYIYYVSVVSFVVIIAVMVYFIVAYRRQTPDDQADKVASHNTWLEIGWSLPVVIVSIPLFYFGAVGYIDQKSPPRDAYEIHVNGFMWGWNFTYPNGYTDATLHVPVDTPVRLTMSSNDVLHSFFIPAFRIKQDVVPGRYTTAWFEATQAGEFQIFCTEYCGLKHSAMLAKTVVHPAGEFEKWLEKASDALKGLPPAEAGEKLYAQYACKGCHSIDGSKLVGPTFKGLWAAKREFVDGSSAAADENYIRSSILNPAGQVVKGYAPVMPTFQGRLKDKEITALIAYIKTLE